MVEMRRIGGELRWVSGMQSVAVAVAVAVAVGVGSEIEGAWERARGKDSRDSRDSRRGKGWQDVREMQME